MISKQGIEQAVVHDLGGAAHAADTLADLNTKVSDATLVDSPVTATRVIQKTCLAGGAGTAETSLGKGPVRTLDLATEEAHFRFDVPHDFTAVSSAIIRVMINANGTIDWTVTTEFGAAGEQKDAHSDSATADDVALTGGEVEEIDFSGALTGIAVGDSVGVTFTLDALTDGALYVMEMIVVYT